jgi:hypothetical protein
MRNSLLPLIGLVCLCLVSCKKDAGEGGTSTIRGKVIIYDHDAAFQNPAPTFIYPGSDEDVFIIYGADNNTYDDDYKTTYDGFYEFRYLQKGKYKMFAYSVDSTGASNGTMNPDHPKIPVFVEVEITSNGSTVTAPDIIILDNNQ